MKALTEQDLATIQRVVSMTDREKKLYTPGRPPGQGQFVAAAMLFDPNRERYVGHCVQVRKGCGQFGSDMVFLRHASGALVVHENQSFYPVSAEQEALLRTVYDPDDLPEAEAYERGYERLGVHEYGFLIEKSATPASPVVPTRLTVRGAGDDLLEDIVIV